MTQQNARIRVISYVIRSVFKFEHAFSFIGKFFFNNYIFAVNMYDSSQRYNSYLKTKIK